MLTVLALVFLSGCNTRHSTSVETPIDTTSNIGSSSTTVADTITHRSPILPWYEDSVLDMREMLISALDFSGCNDVYAIDTDRLNHGQYIFIADLIDHVAIIRIGDQTIHLPQDTARADESVDSTEYSKTFEGSSYKVVFHLHQIRQYDEGGRYQGTLEVEKDDRKTIIPIIGDSGC